MEPRSRGWPAEARGAAWGYPPARLRGTHPITASIRHCCLPLVAMPVLRMSPAPSRAIADVSDVSHAALCSFHLCRCSGAPAENLLDALLHFTTWKQHTTSTPLTLQ